VRRRVGPHEGDAGTGGPASRHHRLRRRTAHAETRRLRRGRRAHRAPEAATSGSRGSLSPPEVSTTTTGRSGIQRPPPASCMTAGERGGRRGLDERPSSRPRARWASEEALVGDPDSLSPRSRSAAEALPRAVARRDREGHGAAPGTMSGPRGRLESVGERPNGSARPSAARPSPARGSAAPSSPSRRRRARRCRRSGPRPPRAPSSEVLRDLPRDRLVDLDTVGVGADRRRDANRSSDTTRGARRPRA